MRTSGSCARSLLAPAAALALAASVAAQGPTETGILIAHVGEGIAEF